MPKQDYHLNILLKTILLTLIQSSKMEPTEKAKTQKGSNGRIMKDYIRHQG